MNIPFSKKEITSRSYQEQAICPSCGEWKTTDFTPQELQERDWECADCANKRLTNPQDLPENKGQQEISKYSPEYDFLKRLINLVVKEGVPPQEIKALSLSSPFQTIDDIGDLTAKIWTLATTKYNIPREWLIKKLPERKASLKQADLKEYSNRGTKEMNDWIVSHPDWMNRVIGQSKDSLDELELEFKLKALLSGIAEEWEIEQPILWNELAYAWFHTIKRDDDWAKLLRDKIDEAQGFKSVDIENLPILDKPKKLDELLDQLSAETDPQRQEQIKQHIERIKRAKLLKADLWPAQEAAEDSTQPPQGYYAYSYGQDRDTSVSGPRPDDVAKEADEEAPCVKCGHKKIDHWWSGQPEAFCKECDNYEMPQCKQYIPKSAKQAKKKKGLSLADVLQILEQKGPKPTHVDYTDLTIEFIDGSKLSFDEATRKALEVNKSSSAESEEQERNKDAGTGFYDSPNNYDMGKRPQGDESIWPADTWLPRGTEEQESQDPTNVMSFLKKQARENAAWIDPSGKVYPVSGDHTHGSWAIKNQELLKKIYGIKIPKFKHYQEQIAPLIEAGWSRIGDIATGPSYGVEVKDIYHINQEVFNYLLEHGGDPDAKITFEERGGPYTIVLYDDLIGQGQKAVNKALRQPVYTFSKKAFLKISQPESGYVDNGVGYTCGRCEYFKDGKCALVQGEIKAQGCCNYWDDKAQLKQEGPGYTKEESGYVEYPNVDYRCDECIFFDGKAKTCTKVEGEISPTASCNLWQPMSKKQSNLKQAGNVIRFFTKKGEEVRVYENPSFEQAQKMLKNSQGSSLRYIVSPEGNLYLWDGWAADHHTAGYDIIGLERWDYDGEIFNEQQLRLELAKELKIKSNLNKKAYIEEAWIAPDGKVFPVGDLHHDSWIAMYTDILEEYGYPKEELDPLNHLNLEDMSMEEEDILGFWFEKLIRDGWIRLNEGSGKAQFVIHVNDMTHLPSVLDEIIAENFDPNDKRPIDIGTYKYHISIYDPFPSLQKAVNKALQQQRMQPAAFSKKELNKKALEVAPRNPNPLVELKVTFNDNELEFMNEIASAMQQARSKAHEADLPFDIEQIYKPTYKNELWIDVYAKSVEEAVDKINSFFQALAQNKKQISSTMQLSLRKQANPPSKFWIAPDGTEFPLTNVHGYWMKQNQNIINQYGIKTKDRTVVDIWNEMTEKGWTRVSDEPAGTRFIIEVNDLSRLPPYLDDFIAKYYTQGEEITLGNGKGQYVKIDNPFPSIQRAVNKALRNPVNAMLKKADISGKAVNDILKLIESNGGATYNLSQGNLVGQNAFAVSIYPDREKIVDLVDYDTLEGYLVDNQDLLNDPKNSFGAWTSGGKVYLDTIITVPTKEEALRLANDNNQLAVFDLKNMQEIPVGVPAMSKKELNIIKKAHDTCEECGKDVHYLKDLCENCEADRKARKKDVKKKADSDVVCSDCGEELCGTCGVCHNCHPEPLNANLKKKAEEQLLTQEQQDQIAAKTSPVYNIALNNYVEAVKRGHSKDRALDYAVDSVNNLEKIDPKKLIELANTYLKGLV